MRAVLSTECPCCEGIKLDGCAFCDVCYTRLPPDIQGRLKNGIRSISAAIFDGIEFLDK